MSLLRLRNRVSVRIAVALCALGIPAVAHALVNLTSGGGFLFDIYETSGGYLSNGSVDAYDGCYYLDVNGIRYNATSPATTTLAGRQVEMGVVTIGGLSVQRMVYVPASGGNYARYLDIISNPGTADVVATVRVSGNLGSDSSTVPTGSSSGDLVVSTADSWFATDDTDGTGDPSLAHVFHGGPGSLVSPTAASQSSDSISWDYSVTVPAGGRVAFLTFAIQEMNRAMSIAAATSVSALPPDTLVGLDAYVGDIVNFPVGGAPVVRFTSPSEADEGAEIVIEAMVEDLEGDTPTWSWDLDDDGVFGELPGGTTYTIPAGTTDGDADITVSIEATDGTETRVVSRTVTVRNVAPTITSEPPLEAFVRREYTYQVVVDDPGGVNDAPAFLLTTQPTGMDVSPEGLITWTPPIDARARTFGVVLRVVDGDMGEDVQTWDIAVADNQPPDPATPMAPINRERVPADAPVTLVATNGTDPDGDPLDVYFQISRTSAFTGPEVLGSGAVTEGIDGTTSWTTAEPLEPGLWYWRVWVSDGIIDSLVRNATFIVGSEATIPDAGPGNTGDGGVIPGIDSGTAIPAPSSGCGCRATGGDDARAPLVGLCFLVAFVAYRRRSR